MAYRTGLAALLLASVISFACAGGPASDSPHHDPCVGVDSVPHLYAGNVPARFRHLLPLAARWGAGNREEREAMERHITTAEIDCLRDALHERRASLMGWVRSIPPGSRRSREACSFKRMLLLYNDVLDMRLRGALK